MLAEVIRLQSLDAHQAKRAIDDLADSLRRQQAELKQMERESAEG